MKSDTKSKIYKILDEIHDASILNMVMENITFYANETDILDELSEQQLTELNQAIKEADNEETISLDDFKNEINKWKRKLL